MGGIRVGLGVGRVGGALRALGPADLARRGAVSDEYLRVFKTLWTQDPASFSGQFYRFADLRCLPQPVQKPHPPIWVGGHSRAALRRAARHVDGWHPGGASPAAVMLPPEVELPLVALRRL